ncbi:SHOCT domain-containing protein [Desulfobacter hydrogenophilus]|uniref:SHOCT domain-containing protein n=1 Tax=Desulfobacter hydrogenophilus TaxID=2291 RepID=A0A328F8A5_9BACT|nr:SHOCT domain-containing protein [Desulfobacter hydrogenophilus]NDY74544.1 SHOCT domain-containing protein [Desulfobacter hydrogenophilus]QBH12314.1 SHOCT domain-containing protein [Desulfobacter hydrogenophilus]RAL99889.1 SHOCT domain-containing protein [Desulfobacter hydrogenophilus]
MQQLTPAGQNIVNDLSQRYNLSQEAVICMLSAVNNGGGSMAQFNCPELGGSGQWMQGGMTMVGDMFNYGLKNTVNNLCTELSNALANTQMFPVVPAGSKNSNQWWPVELGRPFSSGAQNDIRYAVFPNRLAIQLNGQVTVYDTLDNNISGVSQQQGGNTSLTFSSQYGTIAVNTLPIISGPGIPAQKQTNFAQPAPVSNQFDQPDNDSAGNVNNNAVNNAVKNTDTPASISNSVNNSFIDQSSTDGIIALIEKIAKLHEAGALTDEEFNTKKTELLSRI